MGWHVHFKEGRFAIWSTVVDGYVTDWTTEHEVIKMYQEAASSSAENIAKKQIKYAREHGCSALKPFRCDII